MERYNSQMQEEKWEWGGHISRVKDGRWGKIILDWFPAEKRKRGRQKARWSDDITDFIKSKHFTKVAQDRAEWARIKESFAQDMGLSV